MINWDQVAQLRDEVGADEFDEVVDLFLEEVEQVIARLKSVEAQSELREDMHFLKGSALNLGFDAFGQMCQEGERKVAAGHSVELAKLFACYDASRQLFLEGIAGRAVA
jgi:HPt (histidine-containing phosphotransfer) domain-containing protein